MKDKRYWMFFAAMLFVILLASVSNLAVPIFLQIRQNTNTNFSSHTLLFIAIVLIFSKFLSIMATMLRERFAKIFNKQNCNKLISQILKMKYDAILDEGPTSLIDKVIMSTNSIYSFLTNGFIQIWSGILTLSVCLLLVAYASIPVAIILFVLIPVNYVGYRLLNKELSRRAMELQNNTGAGVQEILSYIKQIDYLKQLGNHDNVLRSIEPSIDKIYDSMAKVNTYAQCVASFLGGINEVAKNLCLIYMTIQFTNDAINAYSLVIFSAILPLFFSAIDTIVVANLDRRDYTAALEFQKKVLSQQEVSGSQKIKRISTIELAVDHICLPNRSIPFRLNGKIKKGDIVKINGASGTGKSSFAKALVKFRENEGICFDGIPLIQIDNQSLRSRVEYLSQNVPIIKGSLRENVFFNISWSKELEEKVLADPIMNSILQSKDMDTEILEDGGNLSGGEKQKIALVRALIKDVDVLILDEVCSNIDKESATEIYQRVASERDERITIIISHDELPANLEIIELGGK